MVIVGTIVEILSESHVLVRTSSRLPSATEDYTVYGKVPANQLKDKYGLEFFRLPKGQIRFLSEQADYLYLAKTWRETRTIDLFSGIPTRSLFSGAFKTQSVPLPPSAELAEPTTPIKLEVEMQVQVGDDVGHG